MASYCDYQKSACPYRSIITHSKQLLYQLSTDLTADSILVQMQTQLSIRGLNLESLHLASGGVLRDVEEGRTESQEKVIAVYVGSTGDSFEDDSEPFCDRKCRGSVESEIFICRITHLWSGSRRLVFLARRNVYLSNQLVLPIEIQTQIMKPCVFDYITDAIIHAPKQKPRLRPVKTRDCHISIIRRAVAARLELLVRVLAGDDAHEV